MAKTPYTGQKSACGKFEIRRIRGEQIVPNAAAFSDFQETRFSVVRSKAGGCPARNGFLKPFGSLPNALSFSNSLRKLRLALRRMPAHSLLFDQSNVANSKHTVSCCLREHRLYNSGAKNRSCT